MKKFLRNLLIILLYLLSLNIFIFGLSSNPQYVTASNKYHIALKGETINDIAVKYNISEDKLKLYNNLDDRNLVTGQKIYLHPPDSIKQEYVTVRPIPACKYHIVRKGETLSRIAKMYDIYLFDLLEFNQLFDLTIHEKQKIWLENGLIITTKEIEEDFIPDVRSETPTMEKEKKNVTTSKKVTQETEDILDKKKPAFILPTQGKISSHFGMRAGRPHKGIDIVAPVGTPIYAVDKGTVFFSGYQQGYGNVIMIEHENDIITVYAHNEANLIREGDSVIQGQPIARVGKTGRTTAAHLHFEVRIKGKAQNPLNFLPEFK
jgi:murein DD-endopeptidase MepM/ murein hydrolase activator NlpD